MANEEARDELAWLLMAQQGGDPWAGAPASENIEQGGPGSAPTWAEGFGPQGWQNIYGRLDGTGASEFYTSNDFINNAMGLSGQMGNQDIYNQTLNNIWNMNRSNEGVEPPYFDPRLNAGSMGYNPATDLDRPILWDAKPPEGWLPQSGTPEGYTPDSVPFGSPPGTDWHLQDSPVEMPETPPVDLSTLGFFEGSSPYDGGYNTGLGAGGYGAPGMFGRRRANL
jgi:hypothetical protein